jgi:S1-C subfamily serine protease
MLSEQLQRTIAQACVTVVKQGGRGVLVAGGLVLTAAHCVAYTTERPMVLGDTFRADLQTSHGPIQAAIYAVEPVANIAALGALADQNRLQEFIAFEQWCEQTPPVSVCFELLPVLQSFPIYIYTHKGTWNPGTAQIVREDAQTLVVETSAPIEAGTSGSPIVTARGELVAIVSISNNATGDQGGSDGVHPRPPLALPGWVMRRIATAQPEVEESSP